MPGKAIPKKAHELNPDPGYAYGTLFALSKYEGKGIKEYDKQYISRASLRTDINKITRTF